MAKQNNDYSKIKGLWNESLDKVNNTVNVSSTSISDPGLKKHIDYIRNNSQADWHPEEGYDALQEKLKVAEYNNAKYKADQQGFFGEAGGFLAQAVGGEIVLGTLEGVGYLLDVPGWFDSLSGTEKEYGNWFSDLMKEGKEGLAELVPIYQDPDNQNRSMWQNMIHGDGWWAQNGVSIASAASLLIPVAGWARGIGMAGKGLSMLNTAGKLGKLGKYGALATKPIDIIETFAKAAGATSKTGKFITGGLSKAFVSRHLENTMEAGQIFDEKYQQYIDQGLSEEDAKKYAGEGAAFTYNMGWAMMLQDIPQYMLLGVKGFNISKAVTGAKMAKVANSSIKKAVALNVGRKSFDFLSEGAEEAYQFIVAEEGKYLADVQAGLVKPDETFQERLKKYSEDSELWTSAFFGGLGGNLFNAVAGGVEKRILNKRTGALTEDQERLQELLTWKERTSQSLRDFYEAQDLDDEKAAEVAKSKMTFNMGVEAASVGNWAIRKQQLMDMKNATPEELEKEFNIPKESVSEFVTNIDGHIKNAEKAAKMFAVNMNKFDNSIAYQATYMQYMSEHFTNKIPELNKKVDDLIQQIPNVNSLTPQGKQAFDQKLAKLAAERLIKSNENIISKVKHLSEEDKQHYITKNEELKEIIKEANIKIEEAKRLTLDANDRIAIGHLTGGFADDLVRASIEKEYATFYSNKWLSDLDQFTNNDNLKNIKNKIESEQEELVNKEIKKDNTQKVTKSNEAASGMPTSNKPDDIGTPIPEEVTSTETDMEGFHELVTSGALDINTVEPDIKLEYEKWLSDKESQKQFAKHNVNIIKDSGEIPSNPDIEEFTKGSDNTDTVTQLNTPLAYLSYNNSRAVEEDKTEANKALSDFLESGDSIIGVSVRFEIDYDYLNNNKGRKHYKEIQSALSNKKALTRDQLGVIPIKAVLYRDGELLLHNDQKLTMYLHEDDFFISRGSENATFQTEKLLQTRSIILDGLTKDQIVESELINKTRGKINIDAINYDGSYKQNSYLEVLNKSPENITLIYGDDLGNYLKHDKSIVKELALLTSSSKGAIYAMTNTANGQPFPLRLQTAKIKPSEAELVYTLYSSILSQPKLFKQAVSTKLDNGESLADAINNSTDPIIAGLSQYLDFDKITYSDLLSHIIYEGKNTMSSNESRLLIKLGEEVNGVKTPSTLVYGNTSVTAAELLKPESKNAFIEHLVKNRNRQVDIKYLNNNQYKNYLDVNKILSTNVKPSNGVIFVQPVIEYSDNIQIGNNIVTEESQKKSPETISEKIELEDEFQGAVDMTALLEKALKNQTTTDDFLNNLPDVDDEIPLFKLMIPSDNTINIEEEVSLITKLLPKDISIKLYDSYVQVLNNGAVAAGMFKNNMISLSKLAPIGTAYHEAFHAIFRTMLSSTERGILINDIKKISPIPSEEEITDIMVNNKTSKIDATNIYYEELLADEFAEYMQSKGININKRLSNPIIKFFNTILEWISNVFTSNTITANKLFDNIAKGKYANSTITNKKQQSTAVNKESNNDNVKYILKSVAILTSNKADEVFKKGLKNKWTLDKIMSELQVPKEQKDLILEAINNMVHIEEIPLNEQIALELSAMYNYNIEINTAMSKAGEVDSSIDFEEHWYLDKEDFIMAGNNKPTQYYSNLNVPGGTNYTENEIATSAITPNIKGHAEFSTDNGIGWFRSDNKALQNKIRRILELQSDLFQKGRDKKDLTKDTNVPSDLFEDIYIESQTQGWTKEQFEKEKAKLIEEYGLKTKVKSENQFLQLLNKDNNWVTFFVKSIIQDSAKKGYEKVLFPSGNTASKIEGHTTLEEFKKQKEDRIKQLEEQANKSYSVMLVLPNNELDWLDSFNTKEEAEKALEEAHDSSVYKIISRDASNDNEINQLKQELERVEGPEGFGALKPIYNFYENTVTNILKKQGFNPILITDEYGNTWNEVTISKSHLDTIVFKKINNQEESLSLSQEVIDKIKKCNF